MTPVARRQSATVVRLPLPKVDPKSPAALVLLARLHGNWRRANPHATVDEDLAAGARIRKGLGL
jgi:hypothetical protein